MRISAKTVYGVRALLDLALHIDQGPILSRDIAQRQNIPETYLNQLVLQLRRSGLITSVRGPHGGHMLARPAGALSVLEIWEALEGPLVVVTDNDTDGNQARADAVLNGVWDSLRITMRQELAHTTLGDLSERLRSAHSELTYEI
ncbi:MAG: Rrf2 family transcriptional regulator [Herpetosiphonaceae bacterium]|nr:Rrf2 family transcriptional regulator [Herpetosiphonaceae bacterium]